MKTSHKNLFLYAMIDAYLQLRKSYLGKTSAFDAFERPTKLTVVFIFSYFVGL